MCGADQPERDRGDRRDDDPEQRQWPAAQTIGQLAGERHYQRHSESLRRGQQAGVDHALMADLLPVERQQDHAAEQRGAEAEHRDRRRRERRTAVEPQIEQRTWDMERMDNEAGHQREADQARADHPDRADGPGRADLGQAVGHQHEPARHQREPAVVEALDGFGLDPRKDPEGGDHCDHADRDVDEEDPVPARVFQDQPPDRRSEDRRQHRRDGDDAHHAAHPLWPRGLGHHQLADREDHAAADALQDAECDQLAGRRGEPAEGRAGREQDQRGHVHALGAEPARRPAGDRDHGGERQQVAGHDPLDLIDRRVQFVRQGGERDVDDRRVEDRHDRADDHHRADAPYVGVDAV